jgi:ferredoxin
MRACPTNGLQPAWLAAGPEGVFSPVLVPRRGPCEPGCNTCGQICPTLAVTPLDLEEKHWAKIGGAVIHNNRCLAWAEGKSCVVCQEVCPYGAIEIVQAGGAPVPLVKASKCFGCGYCEQHCPVRVPAITVHPLGALRLYRGSYIQAGRAAGLDLGSRETGDQPLEEAEDGLPPGCS